jgi:hypothetical protein
VVAARVRLAVLQQGRTAAMAARASNGQRPLEPIMRAVVAAERTAVELPEPGEQAVAARALSQRAGQRTERRTLAAVAVVAAVLHLEQQAGMAAPAW